MSKAGKSPTHILRIKGRDKSDKRTNRVGALWENPDGSMSLTLDLGVTLDWRDKKDYMLTVFPVGHEEDNDGP